MADGADEKCREAPKTFDLANSVHVMRDGAGEKRRETPKNGGQAAAELGLRGTEQRQQSRCDVSMGAFLSLLALSGPGGEATGHLLFGQRAGPAGGRWYL